MVYKKETDMAAWGLTIFSLSLFIIGIEEMTWISDLVDYQIVSGPIAISLGIIMLIISIFMFKSGRENSFTMFLWLAVMFLVISQILGFDVSEKEIPILDMVLSFGGYMTKPALVVGCVTAVFCLGYAVWSYRTKGASKLFALMFILLAAFIFIEGFSGQYIYVETVGDLPIMDYYHFNPPFRELRFSAGIIAVAVAIISLYLGFVKPEFLNKQEKLEGNSNAKTCEVVAPGILVSSYLAILLGFGLFFNMGILNDFKVPAQSFGIYGIIAMFILMILAHKSGNKGATVLFLLIDIYFLKMITISFSERPGEITAVVVGAFLLLMAIWIFTKKSQPLTFGVIFTLLAVSMFLLFLRDEIDDKSLECLAGAIAVFASIVMMYVGFAYTKPINLPVY